MTKPSILAFALLGVAASALQAAAAPATQDEADRLRAVFERYVGHPAPGEASSVRVTPEGPGYRADFDLKRMMHPLESFGITVEPMTQTLVLTPNDNGTWHVTSDAMPPIVMHLKDQTITMRTSTYKYDGTYDPKLSAFVDQTMTQDGATLDQDAPALSQHRRSGHGVLTQKAVPADGNTTSLDVHYALSDVSAQMTMRPPAPKATVEVAPTAPPVEFSYAIPTSAVDAHVERLHAAGLLDIWAFFVAHPDRDAIAASQEELRGLLRAALPLALGLKESGAADDLVVKTQIGDFKAHKLGGSVEMADLSGAGRIVAALTLDGLTVPSLNLPPWSVGFMPTALDIRPTVTGAHVDDAVKAAVDTFDLTHDGLTPEQSQKIGHILWPGDGKLVLAPSRITSGLLDIGLEGEATIGDMPSGRLTVTGSGLDKAIATLQQAAGTDETAAQVLAQFVAAKNLAKPNPDGSYVWIIEAAANGPLTVNGIPLK